MKTYLIENVENGSRHMVPGKLLAMFSKGTYMIISKFDSAGQLPPGARHPSKEVLVTKPGKTKAEKAKEAKARAKAKAEKEKAQQNS